MSDVPSSPIGASVASSPLIPEESIAESTTFAPSIPSISTSPLTDTPLSAHSGEENDYSLHKFVDTLCQSIGFDKTQLYVLLILVVLLILNSFCIWIAWSYYSPKIRAYQDNERRYRARIQADKDKKAFDKKDD